MRSFAEVKAEMLADPAVAEAHAELREVLAGSIARDFRSAAHSKYMAQTQRRAWRAKQRAAHLAPLSAKVVYPRKLVDVAPQPKKRGGK